jgi:hypothetical protein
MRTIPDLEKTIREYEGFVEHSYKLAHECFVDAEQFRFETPILDKLFSKYMRHWYFETGVIHAQNGRTYEHTIIKIVSSIDMLKQIESLDQEIARKNKEHEENIASLNLDLAEAEKRLNAAYIRILEKTPIPDRLN